MRALSCPRCAIPMDPQRVGAGRGWQCGRCEGHALSVVILRRTASRDRFNELWQSVRAERQREGPPCAACGSPMTTATLPAAAGGQLEVDACKACQLLWFDAGERDDLGQAAAEPKGPAPKTEIPLEAARTLAIMRADQIRRQADDEVVERPTSSSWQQLATWVGLPAEMDAPTARSPLVTWTLAGLIVLTALLINTGTLRPETLAFLPAEPLRGGGLPMLTSFFVHAGWLHLFLNVYFLVVFGDNVEDTFGALPYLLLVAAATAAGALLHGMLDPRTGIILVGASGGISGVLVCYALIFPRARLGFRWWHWAFGERWIQVPAALVFVVWFGLQVVFALMQTGGDGRVSALAHLGGVAVGVAAWAWWRRR